MGLTNKEKVSYGIGAVGKDMVYTLVSGFLLYYYKTVLGINASFVGVVFMIARIFDAFNDRFMGIVVAKTRLKYGKFRPWILLGTVLNAMILVSMYSVPRGLTGVPLLMYASVMYLLWGITYTIMDIPYWSMLPAITTSGKDREQMSVIARSCAGVGAAIPTALTMFLVSKIGDSERTAFMMIAAAVGAVFLFAEIICVKHVKEQNQAEPEKSVSVGEMFRALFQNDQALVVVVSIIIFNASLYLTQQLGVYYFEHDFGNKALFGLFGTVGGAAQILSMMMLPLLRKKFQCREILKGAIGLALIGYLLLFILMNMGIKNIAVLCCVGVIVFVGFGLATVLTTIFLADTVDYGEWKNGQRNESVIFSLQTFVVKLASAFSVLIAGVGLDVIRLNEHVKEQTAFTLIGLRVLMVVLPMAGLVCSIVYFTRKYKLDEEMLHIISNELKGRKSENDKKAE